MRENMLFTNPNVSRRTLLTIMTAHKLQLKARDFGLVDLDEYTPCAKFADVIRVQVDGKKLNEIELNLEFCWVEYSFTHLFLDEALSKLRDSELPHRILTVVVSINLGDARFMAALLFRLSKLVNRDSEGSPEAILRAVNFFCSENCIKILIQSRIVLDGFGDATTEEFIIDGWR